MPGVMPGVGGRGQGGGNVVVACVKSRDFSFNENFPLCAFIVQCAFVIIIIIIIIIRPLTGVVVEGSESRRSWSISPCRPVCDLGQDVRHRHACPFLYIVGPTLALPSSSANAIDGAMRDGLAQAVVSHDMAKSRQHYEDVKANLAAWVNAILRNELSYLLLFSVDHNHARRHWIANQRRLVQYMTHFHS